MGVGRQDSTRSTTAQLAFDLEYLEVSFSLPTNLP